MLWGSFSERWQGSDVPDKVGTLRVKQVVTLQPMQEHLVWARAFQLTVLLSLSPQVLARDLGTFLKGEPWQS